jgi:hypothetical protein
LQGFAKAVGDVPLERLVAGELRQS